MGQKILITGSTGFVGKLLVTYLQAKGHDIITPKRSDIGDIGPNSDWNDYLKGVDTVIHLAGRAHVMQEDAKDPTALYQHVNNLGTAQLAGQALKSGVKRFIFASSVKVMGESSDHPLSALIDAPAPSDPYGQSKLDGEEALTLLNQQMDVVILRLPLVYGAGVKGNFINLLKLLQKGFPLPFGAIHNKRSMIYTGNLMDVIDASLVVAPGVYFPSDQDDLSTAELVKILSNALGKNALLIPIPGFLLHLAGLLTGRSEMVRRLTGSLSVDGKLGDWTAPYSAKEGLIETAKYYKSEGTTK